MNLFTFGGNSIMVTDHELFVIKKNTNIVTLYEKDYTYISVPKTGVDIGIIKMVSIKFNICRRFIEIKKYI